jgi:hypothetical protein
VASFFSPTLARSVQSEKIYDFNAEITGAYSLVTSLRFQEAYQILNKIKKANPDNQAALIVEDYIDLLALLVSEDQKLLKKLAENKSIRLNKLENFGNKQSPYYLFLQAEVYMHWAAIDMRFGNYFTSLNGAYKAYNLLIQNKKLFPNFVPNLKNLGLIHVLVGAIPDKYKRGLTFITGIEGDIGKGLSEIQTVLNYSKNNKFIFEQETKILYAFLLMHIANEPENAWNKISNDKINYNEEPLMAYIYANAAYRSKNNDECINILENRTYDSRFYPFHTAKLLLGRAKLNKLDSDANIYLEAFIKNHQGQSMIKEAHLLLFWYYTIFENSQKANLHKQAVLNDGESVLESDKSAIQEIKLNKNITKSLLKARLLFDGSYFEKSLQELDKINLEQLKIKAINLEYLYRKARIFQQMNKDNEAIKIYKLVVQHGKTEPYYFACNAALQIAQIFEKQKNTAQAKIYFNECLKIDPPVYQNSLHSKAKSGIIRLKSN